MIITTTGNGELIRLFVVCVSRKHIVLAFIKIAWNKVGNMFGRVGATVRTIWRPGLTLFDMGGIMGNVFDQTLRRKKLKLGDF